MYQIGFDLRCLVAKFNFARFIQFWVLEFFIESVFCKHFCFNLNWTCSSLSSRQPGYLDLIPDPRQTHLYFVFLYLFCFLAITVCLGMEGMSPVFEIVSKNNFYHLEVDYIVIIWNTSPVRWRQDEIFELKTVSKYYWHVHFLD